MMNSYTTQIHRILNDVKGSIFFFLLFFFDNDKTRKQFKPAETNQNHLCQLRKTTKKTTHISS